MSVLFNSLMKQSKEKTCSFRRWKTPKEDYDEVQPREYNLGLVLVQNHAELEAYTQNLASLQDESKSCHEHNIFRINLYKPALSADSQRLPPESSADMRVASANVHWWPVVAASELSTGGHITRVMAAFSKFSSSASTNAAADICHARQRKGALRAENHRARAKRLFKKPTL
ncbi:hypothetical protein R3P38DRAFT_2788931 [Favolaschia claudopus]|uniref:Uncharacterized protein n=1 Tax=Favolaschia claudopus TaxID=2862362 RepID=A0AAW0AJR7_9AGAR